MSMRRASRANDGTIHVLADASYAVELAGSDPTPNKALNPGEFIGHATVFGSPFFLFHDELWEDVETVIVPGAFQATLAARGANKPVPVYRDHNEAIGPSLEVKEDATGLFVHGRVSQTTLGKDTLQLMADRVLTEMSIAIRIDESNLARRADGTYLWSLTKLHLKEVTVTAYGHVPGTSIDEVAAAEMAIGTHPLDKVAAFAKANSGRQLNAAQAAKVRGAVELLSALLGSGEGGTAASDEQERLTLIQTLEAEIALCEALTA